MTSTVYIETAELIVFFSLERDAGSYSPNLPPLLGTVLPRMVGGLTSLY